MACDPAYPERESVGLEKDRRSLDQRVEFHRSIMASAECVYQDRELSVNHVSFCAESRGLTSMALLMLSVPKTHPTAMDSHSARIRMGMFIPAQEIFYYHL